MSAASGRPRRGPLVTSARALTWPLALATGILGTIWRLVAAVFSSRPLARLRAYATGWGDYLLWRQDRIPPLSGNPQYLNESAGNWHEARRRLAKSSTAMWAWIGIVVFVYIGLAAQAGWIARGFETAVDKDHVYRAPQWFSGPYFLGTDQLGLDVWKLVLRGTTTALWIGAIAATLSCVIGTVLGALAGYFGRWVDVLIVWIYTTLESIPYLLLLLAISYALKSNPSFGEWYGDTFLATKLGISVGLFRLVVTLGLTSWVGVCRTVRGEMLRHRDRDYVTAAKALGIPTTRIIFRHLVPNVFHLVLVSYSLLFVSSIKSEVILSFLGLGLDPGEASWGQMIGQARLELLRSPDPVWWQLTAATVFMFFLVLCVNLFSDALRDALDPKLKH